MNAEAYELLVNLCTLERPSTKTFQQITAVLESYLQPKPIELAERYKFRHRTQNGGEATAEYTTVLKRMPKTCEFGSCLEEILRNQLLCGISSDTMSLIIISLLLQYGICYVKEELYGRSV